MLNTMIRTIQLTQGNVGVRILDPAIKQDKLQFYPDSYEHIIVPLANDYINFIQIVDYLPAAQISNQNTPTMLREDGKKYFNILKWYLEKLATTAFIKHDADIISECLNKFNYLKTLFEQTLGFKNLSPAIVQVSFLIRGGIDTLTQERDRCLRTLKAEQEITRMAARAEQLRQGVEHFAEQRLQEAEHSAAQAQSLSSSIARLQQESATLMAAHSREIAPNPKDILTQELAKAGFFTPETTDKQRQDLGVLLKTIDNMPPQSHKL